MLSSFTPRLIEWQRKLDPENFTKKTGATYHTAPAVLPPDSPDYPCDVPEEAVAVMFHLNSTCWMFGEPKKSIVRNPTFEEGKPRSKKAKNGPIFIMSDDTVICCVPFNENYYWTAKFLSQHDVVYLSMKPGLKRDDDKPIKVQMVAAFIPNDGEE